MIDWFKDHNIFFCFFQVSNMIFALIKLIQTSKALTILQYHYSEINGCIFFHKMRGFFLFVNAMLY